MTEQDGVAVLREMSDALDPNWPLDAPRAIALTRAIAAIEFKQAVERLIDQRDQWKIKRSTFEKEVMKLLTEKAG